MKKEYVVPNSDLITKVNIITSSIVEDETATGDEYEKDVFDESSSS